MKGQPTVNGVNAGDTPSLAALTAAVAAFGGSAGDIPQFAGAPFDPVVAGHCRMLLSWLNAWGCRIRYPRDDEPDLFAGQMCGWWQRHGGALPPATARLADLSDAEITLAGGCFAALAAIAVGDPARPRTLGPTAAAKVLYALRPNALMPWDEAIARRLHGGRDAVAYVAHQRLGRAWARSLIDATGLAEAQLAATLGGAERPLAKILDDYCYLRFTRMEQL